MDHALLLFIVFFFFCRPSPMTILFKFGCLKEIEFYHSGSFLLIRENVVISLKTFSQHHVVTHQKVVGFYMN